MRQAKKSILIVDDEYAILETLEMVLLDAGYAVVTAVNGEEALRTAFKIRPDLILLDVMMPILDGFEVLLMLRARLGTKNVPVVMISGIYPVDKQEGYGWNAWLDKPFDLPTVLRTVEEIIGPGRHRSS